MLCARDSDYLLEVGLRARLIYYFTVSARRLRRSNPLSTTNRRADD